MVDFTKLAAPFDPKRVSWRVGQVTKKDPRKASALCYIDARDVMERLDAVCGPDGWEDSYVETAKGRVICTIRLNIQNALWVSKSDGAGDTAVEGDKGGISDSFKRAAVKWGIGRYLYDIPVQYVAINEFKQIEKHEYTKLAAVLPGSRVVGGDDADDAPASPPKPPADPAVEELRRKVNAVAVAIEGCQSVEAVNKLMENYGWNAKSKVADQNTLLAEVRAYKFETYEALVRKAKGRRHFLANAPQKDAA